MVGDNAINTILTAKAGVNYIGNANSANEASIETNTISNSVTRAEVTLNMIMTARFEELVRSGKKYPFHLKVKNTSGKSLSNVKITINPNEFYKLEKIFYGNEVIDFEHNTFYISNLDIDELKEYEIDVLAEGEKGIATISAQANDLYYSNEVSDNIKSTNVAVSLTANNEGETLKDDSQILYNIKVTNTGTDVIDNFEVKLELSNLLNVKKISANGNEIQFNQKVEYNEGEKPKQNIGIAYKEQLDAGESVDFLVETEINEDFLHSDDINLTSIAQAKVKTLIANSEEVNHILKANNYTSNTTESGKDNSGNNDNNQNNENPNENNENGYVINNGTDTTNESNSKNTISGTAWFDENADGKRDSNEKTLGGIKVTLLNLEDNTTATATTTENGFYAISNVANGKYVEIFEYDTDKYMLTKYHAENVQDARNSDVENVTMNLNGENKKVASTDTLTVNNSSLTNIDIGLMEAKIFDLSLSKSISKVSISNTNGTESKEYNSSELAKIEIKAKYLSGTTAVIEYKIKVTNNGEVAGYARNIVDYKPADLNFNSKLNPDWYQSGEYLYSTALANTKIEAGESKELTLVLTKTMTENNTGLTNNTAEIAESYNALGIEDRNSTSGNKQAKEDDLGQANIILSVSTGAAVSYISLTLSIIAVIAVGAYIITKKILKENVKI